MILKETVNLYISDGVKNDLTGRMQRALCNDMDKLFENIDNEINALPPERRKVIWEDFLCLLNDRELSYHMITGITLPVGMNKIVRAYNGENRYA